MSASTIPPPIVNSVYMPSSPPSATDASVHADDSLLLFKRKQRQLEAHLQLLLDAQADALLSGLDAPPPLSAEDDGFSTGSTTPTADALKSKPTRPSKSVKIGLRDARIGLYATIRRLAQLKAQESQYLTPNLDHFSSVVAQLDTWQRKSQGLQSKASQIRSGNDHKHALDLHKQADDMQNDIDDLEARLAQLKSDQRKLRIEAQEIENTISARLSSYTTSLSLVDDAVQNFLQHDTTNQWPAVINVAGMNRFWQLPHQHRTLKAAKDVFTQERESLFEKRRVNDTEREALEEGAIVWKDTVKQVSAFERTLAKAMSHIGKQSQPPSVEVDSTPSSSSVNTKELLSLLDQTTTELESRHKLAEERNWKLLVCAIGAELEAFLKGKQILEAALASADDNDDMNFDESKGHATGSGYLEGAQTPRGSKHDDGEAIRDLDKAFKAKHAAPSVSDTDTEDDGPDPELLVSHQDTDTD